MREPTPEGPPKTPKPHLQVLRVLLECLLKSLSPATNTQSIPNPYKP
jgi:hypothetical protein